MRKLAIIALLCLGVIVAASPTRAYGTIPFVGNAGIPVTPTPAAVLQPWAYVAGTGSQEIPDMGATPDAYLIQNIDWNQEAVPATTYCGVTVGPANCVPTKYTDQFANHCSTNQEIAVMTWIGFPNPASQQATHETAMMHEYPSNPTPSPAATPERLVNIGTSASGCNTYNPNGHGFAILTRPNDAGLLTELQTLWAMTGTNYYPSPYGVYEDHGGITGFGITGGGSASTAQFSTEKSSGYNSGNTQRITVAGTGTYTDSVDYATSVGDFVNSACPGSPCLQMVVNGGAATASNTSTLACDVIASSTCWDNNYTGDIDNTYVQAYDNVVAADTAGNLLGFDLESPFFSHISPYTYCSVTQCDTMLNTFANLYTDTGTGSIKLYDAEPPWGTGGPGDLTTGIAVRTFAIAADWLFANPSTSQPDRVVPRRLVIGGTIQEAPAFFELTLTPFAVEHATTKYVWNGATVTNGGSCDGGSINAHGDTGGLTTLVQACATGDNGGIYVQQYAGLKDSLKTNHGKMAVIINTSATDTFTISPGWFTGDPITSYSYQLALGGGELTCVPYAGVNDGDGVNCATTSNIAISCTNPTYCTGAQTPGGNVTPFRPGSPGKISPDSAVILVQK